MAGWDTRTDEEYVTMVLATLISGAGATPQQDGWHACGPQSCFGALTSGDVELIEHSYPVIIHSYNLMTDSGGAGKFRGGSGTRWEVEPIDKPMTLVMFGEGRRLPAMGAANARSAMIDSKVGRVEIKRGDDVEIIRKNIITTIQPGETATNKNPGGGGYGDPFDRPIEKVTWDVKNNLVSIEGAREDYGVVIQNADTLEVDKTATAALRSNRPAPKVIHPQAKLIAAVEQTQTPVSDLAPAPVKTVDIAASASTPTQRANDPVNEPVQPVTGADVGFIRIVDFDNPEQQRQKPKYKMKIRYF
jgi:N-methylhydantoinase B